MASSEIRTLDPIVQEAPLLFTGSLPLYNYWRLALRLIRIILRVGSIPMVMKSSSVSNVDTSGRFEDSFGIYTALMGLGLLRLEKRMRPLYSNWRPVFLRHKSVLYPVVLLFVGINILILVTTAMPEKKGMIPRFYWPIAIGAALTFGSLYWGIIMLLRTKLRRDGKTLGRMIGFEILIYEPGRDDVPENMHSLMQAAQSRGSRKIVHYTVSCIRPGAVVFGREIVTNILNRFLAMLKLYMDGTRRL